MRTVVVTGMWGDAWERYGFEFAETFAKHWPQDVELVIYTDRPSLPVTRGEVRQLGDVPGYATFLDRYSSDVYATGRAKAMHAGWKPKDIANGYSWSHDAVKWFPQGLIPADAARDIRGEAVLCWLDADVITTRAITPDWLNDIIGGANGAYLGRVDSHSEIGFWAVRLPRGLEMVETFSRIYTSGGFQKEAQSHSAFIWDLARERSGLRLRDLSPNGSGHVFRVSALAKFLEHRKGALKSR